MTPATLVLAAASLLAAMAPAGNAGAEDAGFVLDMRGEWEMAGSPPVGLRIGHAVPAGATIRPRAVHPSSFITVVLFDGKTTLTRSCRVSGECAKPLLMPAPADADPFWARALKAMGALLSRQEETLVPVMSREVFAADEEVQAHEAVVALAGGSVDLSAVLQGSAAGRYTLLVERVTAARETSPLTTTLDWQPGRPAKIGAGGLEPGLYAVTVLPERDEVYAPTGASAWVLVSLPATFDARAKEFARAVAMTETWEKPVRRQAVRRFLRASLELLANGHGTEGEE